MAKENKYRLVRNNKTGVLRFDQLHYDMRNESYYMPAAILCPQSEIEALKKLADLNFEEKWEAIG